MSIYLYSPILPAKTGTANYFSLFLRDLGFDEDYSVVVDSKFYNNLDEREFKIVDYKSVKKTKDDVSVYFLANNEFHRYCHRELFFHTKNDGKVISIVHEPAMWMNIYAMCSLGEYGFTKADLEYFGNYEFGDDTTFIVDQAINGKAEYNFDYTSLAGTHIYEKSDVIVFHSYFAKNKFIAEKSPTYKCRRLDAPKYIVMEHPTENIRQSNTLDEKEKFVVGTYGWVKKTKLIEPLIRSFYSFYNELSQSEKENVRLDIVGEVDRTRDFDPHNLSKQFVSDRATNFYGYVSNEKMNKLMAESSVMFALRFPSCGETSGPVYKAKTLNTALVLSDYAAFSELPASYHVTVNFNDMESEIKRILSYEHKLFLKKLNPTKAVQHGKFSYLGVKDMLEEALNVMDNITR